MAGAFTGVAGFAWTTGNRLRVPGLRRGSRVRGNRGRLRRHGGRRHRRSRRRGRFRPCVLVVHHRFGSLDRSVCRRSGGGRSDGAGFRHWDGLAGGQIRPSARAAAHGYQRDHPTATLLLSIPSDSLQMRETARAVPALLHDFFGRTGTRDSRPRRNQPGRCPVLRALYSAGWHIPWDPARCQILRRAPRIRGYAGWCRSWLTSSCWVPASSAARWPRS